MKDNFIQYLEQNFDSFVDLCKRRKWLAVIAALFVLYFLILHFKIYPHMNSLEDNLKNLREENNLLQTQLAPFLAVANKEFSDQPENKRLELLIREMDIIEKSFIEMQQLVEKQKNHIDTLNEIQRLDSLISEIISDNLVSLKELTKLANDTDYPFNKEALDKFHVAISDLWDELMRVYSWGSMIYVKIEINIDTIQKGMDWIGSLDNNKETFSEHQKKVISLLQNENIPFNIKFEIGLYILNNTNSARQYINVSVMLRHMILKINDPRSREIQFTSKTVVDIINWWNENKINYSKN